MQKIMAGEDVAPPVQPDSAFLQKSRVRGLPDRDEDGGGMDLLCLSGLIVEWDAIANAHLSGAVIGKRFVLHVAFDMAELREKSISVSKGVG